MFYVGMDENDPNWYNPMPERECDKFEGCKPEDLRMLHEDKDLEQEFYDSEKTKWVKFHGEFKTHDDLVKWKSYIVPKMKEYKK